jgi:predicted flap endonuclease-1-like 5' DNA nuclease
MSYPLTEIDGIDQDVAKLLKSCGIRSTAKFLEVAKAAKGRRDLSIKTGLDDKTLLRWANLADQMRIKGIGEGYAELLHEVGVKTVRDLKFRNASKLAHAIAAANAKRNLVKLPPSEKAVARWIEQAKKLPLKITY